MKKAKGDEMPLCSLAIAAGVIGVAAVVKRFVFRRHFGGGRWNALHACGPNFGTYGFGGGPGASFWLRSVFSRLDTTPGQEREIRAAIEDVQSVASGAREGLRGVRQDVAKAIGGETFDDVAIGEASARADVTTGQVKDAFTNGLRRIHAVLDPKQRERLAELMSKGPGFGRRRGGWNGGPYRDV